MGGDPLGMGREGQDLLQRAAAVPRATPVSRPSVHPPVHPSDTGSTCESCLSASMCRDSRC